MQKFCNAPFHSFKCFSSVFWYCTVPTQQSMGKASVGAAERRHILAGSFLYHHSIQIHTCYSLFDALPLWYWIPSTVYCLLVIPFQLHLLAFLIYFLSIILNQFVKHNINMIIICNFPVIGLCPYHIPSMSILNPTWLYLILASPNLLILSWSTFSLLSNIITIVCFSSYPSFLIMPVSHHMCTLTSFPLWCEHFSVPTS